MDQAVLHPQTERLLRMFQHNPTSCVILHGLQGVGKTYVATILAASYCNLPSVDRLESYPYWHRVTPNGATISIETIRELQTSLKLSLPVGKRRVIALIDAHTLTIEAQNALLKTLEEPPANTLIILTTSSLEALLPTIRSRSQAIPIQPPSTAQIEAFFTKQGIVINTQHLALANGRVGLAYALHADADHPLLSAITTAKTIVGASPVERISMVDGLLKQKDTIGQVLEALGLIFRSLIRGQLQSGKNSAAQASIERLAATLAAQDQLKRSVQAKLVLDNLFLHL